MGKISSNNLTAKILALILAAVLWIYVMNEQNPPIDSTFTVPVQIRNANTSMVVTDAPDIARVKLRGPRSIIAGVLTNDIQCYIDLKGLGEGRHNVKIVTQVPGSLEIVETNPDKAAIRIESSISRQLPIEVRLTGNAAAGAVVSRVTSSQENVTFAGSRSAVESVEKVIVPVDISGKSADFQASVPAIPVNRAGKEVEGLTVIPDKVQVTVAVAKESLKKTIDIRPLTYGELHTGYSLSSITTEPARVEVTGLADVLEKLDFVYTEPVNLSGISNNTKREVKLQLREGLAAAKNVVEVHIVVESRQ